MSDNHHEPISNIISFDKHRRAEKLKRHSFMADAFEMREMTLAEDKAVLEAMAELEALEDADVRDGDQKSKR